MRYSKLTLFNARLSNRFFHSQLALRSNVSKNLNINQQERLNKLVQDENYKFWLGGFIEGEGSLVISIVKNEKLKFKLALQPEFNVVQHENGILVLYGYQTLFGDKGSVHKKSGSDKVWVYSIKGTENLMKYVLPYFNKYVAIYSSKYKTDILQNFTRVLTRLAENKEKTISKEEMIEFIKLVYEFNPDGKGIPISKEEMIELIKLVYEFNPDGKGKQRKSTLQETLDIVNSAL